MSGAGSVSIKTEHFDVEAAGTWQLQNQDLQQILWQKELQPPPLLLQTQAPPGLATMSLSEGKMFLQQQLQSQLQQNLQHEMALADLRKQQQTTAAAVAAQQMMCLQQQQQGRQGQEAQQVRKPGSSPLYCIYISSHKCASLHSDWI